MRDGKVARPGDYVEVRERGGVRRGEIVEVLGERDRTHFQVRWSAAYESMVFPGEDVRVIRAPRGAEPSR